MLSFRRIAMALLVMAIVFLALLFVSTVILPALGALPLVAPLAAFLNQWAVIIAIIVGLLWYFSGATFFGR